LGLKSKKLEVGGNCIMSCIIPATLIRMMKSRRMRWSWNVARMRREGMLVVFWWESQKERDHYEDLGVDGRMMLTVTLSRERMGWYGLDLSDSGEGTAKSSCERKCWDIHELLSTWRLFKRDKAP
jgi:hypothetical protein